jgi:hypothetical protein
MSSKHSSTFLANSNDLGNLLVAHSVSSAFGMDRVLIQVTQLCTRHHHHDHHFVVDIQSKRSGGHPEPGFQSTRTRNARIERLVREVRVGIELSEAISELADEQILQRQNLGDPTVPSRRTGRRH